MSTHILTQAIENAVKEGRTALIPFLTAAFPDKHSFWHNLVQLDANGADIIEIGVPFSDPVADGPVVEAASLTALKNGASLAWLLAGLRKRAGSFKAPLVLMGYYNPFLQYGLERLVEDAAKAGISGFVVPDLPLDEDRPLRQELKKKNMALVPLVGVNTSEERLRAYAQKAEGYVYLVSVLGTTGMRNEFSPELQHAFDMVKTIFDVPMALGFGIAGPEQAAALPVRPKALVFGSALLRHLEAGNDAASFMRRWL